MRTDGSIKRYPASGAGAMFLLLAVSLALLLPSSATAKGALPAGNLDCNGYSPIQAPLRSSMMCTEVEQANSTNAYLDNGWYVGHDEPSLEFLSNTPGSGDSAQYQLTLPNEPSLPASGSPLGPVWDFQLTPAFWFGMVLCDTQSWPEGSNSCTPDSDSNIQVPPQSNHAGSAYMELQFYPPGWAPFINQLSCDQVHWCAALTIDSLQANYDESTINANCEEPVNFAFLTHDGTPIGPPGPDTATAATFDTPANPDVLLMNPGDKISVSMNDTPGGFVTNVADSTTGTTGTMIASAGNGFRHIVWDPTGTTCNGAPYTFHPEYSTAGGYVRTTPSNTTPGEPSTVLEPQTWAGWSAHTYNISYTVEIGHFEAPDNGGGEKPAKGKGSPFKQQETPCYSGPTIPGCIGSDVPDFDGYPYQADWPNSMSAGAFPSPTLTSSPVSLNTNGKFSNAYGDVQFEADIPRIEAADSGGACDRYTGVGCTDPPPPAAFYPWFHEVAPTTGTCAFTLANTIPGELNGYGGEQTEFGPLEYTQYNTAANGTKADNYASGATANPCP
jgi:hypothetical protein